MISDEVEGYLDKIYYALIDDDEYPFEDTLLYSKVEEGMISIAIFKDLGDQALWRDGPEDLCSIIYDFWEIEEPEKRWARMEFMVRGGSFEVSYIYPEEIDPEEDWMELRNMIIRRYFGNKPDVYPPPPQSGQIFELRDDR